MIIYEFFLALAKYETKVHKNLIYQNKIVFLVDFTISLKFTVQYWVQCSTD